ncbi:MAG: ABC transporter substrate-binding protein [Aquabacterium sp.]|nr:ABC transporter substrate-binding protein [Aquabacterium sp.]
MKTILAALLIMAGAHAQAASEIRIGQTADFSNMAAAQMKDFNAGAGAAFTVVNNAGGIHGQPIKLMTLDDGFNADAAAANATRLIEKDAVIALFGSRGTDPSEAVMKVAEAHRIPLIAPITGADTVRKNKFTFAVRAAYRTEIEGIFKQLAMSPTRLAVLVQDDKFGNPLSDFINELVKKTPAVQVVAMVRFPRKETKLHPQADAILNSKPTAVLALCNPASCQAFTKEILAMTTNTGRARPTIYQTSIADIYADFAKLGAIGVQGNAFAQVFPDPNRAFSQINKDYKAAMARSGGTINYRSFEGYVSARVLIEALKRAKTISSAGIIDALESMDSGFDLGGFSVRYSSRLHEGSTFFDLVTMDKNGRLVH